MQKPLNTLSKNELIQLVLEQGIQHETVRLECKKAQANCEKPQTDCEKAQAEITRLSFIIEKLKRMLFGSQKEHFEGDEHASQLNLPFEEMEAANENTTDAPVKETITYSRDKNKNDKGRNRLPDDLPEREIIIEPSGDTTGLVKIG